MSECKETLLRWEAELNASNLVRIRPEGTANADKLCESRLNLVIVMVEPCNNHDTTSYKEMVAGSPALQEVDRLVRETSDGNYGISDVPILDIRPLISKKMRNAFGAVWPRWEDRAHKVFEEMLLLKKPDVVLSLQCSTRDAESPTLRGLCGVRGGSQSPNIRKIGNHETLVFRGLHPSSYLRPDYTANKSHLEIVDLREGLRLCFQSAFLALRGQRSVRWNDCNTPDRPWKFMTSVVARMQGKDKQYARDMTPSQLFGSLNLQGQEVSNMRLSLVKEMRIESKLQQLKRIYFENAADSDCSHEFVGKPAIPTQRPCRNDIAPEELIELLNALSVA